ncbi:rod shape-determining protein MreC, partial [Enterococcus lactis]|nr:rod shape-determining protein MreC [Enterococcus lactis]
MVIIVETIQSVTAAQRANEGKPNFFDSIVNVSVAMVDKTISAPVRWVRYGVDSVHILFSSFADYVRL